MARTDTRAADTASPATPLERPSVLVVLVVRNGARWLRQCLRGLSRQSHPRVGVLALDNASTDGSADLLEQALGTSRVIRLTEDAGFAGAVREALRTDIAGQADYILLLHDDTVLAPDSIAGLVEAAERIEGAGIVGPKILDWDQPRLLRSIGMSTDRFGYPYSPLEDEEIDQGQYDRIREVFFVSSCALLMSKVVWSRIGVPDERYVTHDEDPDYCWRARLAGFRVVVTPLAEARHRHASGLGERPGVTVGHHRYRRERAALANMLKNYGFLSLLLVLPPYVGLGIGRILLFVAGRRFEDAAQVLAAWGWNIAHLPGTFGRRLRAQSLRAVPDRSIRHFMAPAGDRMRRLGAVVRQALFPRPALAPEDDQDERVIVPFRVNLARFALAHPVAMAWMVAAIVAAIAYRNVFTAPELAGGAFPAFPSSPTEFFRELVSGLRQGGLGGTQQASPALGWLGVGSVVTLGSTLLLQKLLLVGLPALAGAGCYRALRRLVPSKVPAVIGAATFVFSPLMLWSISEGRLSALVLLGGLPWLASKLISVSAEGAEVRPLRWIVAFTVGVGLLVAFYPGAAMATGVLVLCALVLPPSGTARGRGLSLALGGLIGAAVLAFPVALALIRGGGEGLADHVGAPTFASLTRLVVGGGPGDWSLAFYLPVAAALSLLFVSGPATRAAAWAAFLAVASVSLAWLAGAGRLPEPLANPVAFTALTAFAYAVLVALGLVSVIEGVARHAFGHRQVGGALLAAAVTIGLLGQIAQAARGAWEVGDAADALPDAYPVVAGTPQDTSFRVLWIGSWSGGALIAPGGVPDGRVEAGSASIRYAITLPGGSSALDVGRPGSGPGYDRLEQSLADILAGRTLHGGALLAPFGIRFVVADPRDIPRPARRRLSRQLDLDQLAPGGLVVYRVPGGVPLPTALVDAQWLRAARRPAFVSVASLPPATIDGAVPGEATTGTGPRLLLLPQQFDRRWSLEGQARSEPPFRAFDWAVGFETETGQPTGVRFGGQVLRNVQVALLAVLWLGALWIIRRPATRG
jgi:GT2 family glycosyltransferase